MISAILSKWRILGIKIRNSLHEHVFTLYNMGLNLPYSSYNVLIIHSIRFSEK